MMMETSLYTLVSRTSPISLLDPRVRISPWLWRDNYAEVVYIGGDDLSISGDSGDRVYILDSKPDAAVDSDDNDYYEYDAIVNGKNTTIKANDDDIFEQVGLYQNVSYDSNDYVNRAKLVEGYRK